MGKIVLKDLEFHAFHGVYPEEKTSGNRFTVNVIVEGNWSEAEISDNLENTLNYVQLYYLIENVMHESSDLLENVVYRINKKVLEVFGSVIQVETEVFKHNPPIEGNINHVGYKNKMERK